MTDENENREQPVEVAEPLTEAQLDIVTRHEQPEPTRQERRDEQVRTRLLKAEATVARMREREVMRELATLGVADTVMFMRMAEVPLTDVWDDDADQPDVEGLRAVVERVVAEHPVLRRPVTHHADIGPKPTTPQRDASWSGLFARR